MKATATVATSGFQNFIQQHDQLLTVIGALIVFLSFYTKEVRLEKINALQGELAAAKTNARISDQTQNIRDDIARLSDQVLDLQTNGSNSSSGSLFHDEYMRILDSTDSFGAAQDQLSAARELIAQLPLGTHQLDTEAARLEGSIPALIHLQDQALSMSDQMKLGKMKNGDEVKDNSGYEKLMGIASQFVSGVASLSNGVKNLRTSLDNEVQRQLTQLGRESGGATSVTYLLFGFGWAMGLIGKVLNIPALSGGD